MDSKGWCNVRRIAKNLKVVYTLRDPLDRLWSHYKFHAKWVGRGSEVLNEGIDNFKNLLDKHFFWVNGEYSNNYKLIKSSVRDDEFMVTYFEDFREDPSGMLVKVYDFLGIKHLPSSVEKLNKKVNSAKGFVMPSEWRGYALQKLRKRVY